MLPLLYFRNADDANARNDAADEDEGTSRNGDASDEALSYDDYDGPHGSHDDGLGIACSI